MEESDQTEVPSIESAVNEILSIEDELELFGLRIDDVPVWERIRFSVYQELLVTAGIAGEARNRIPLSAGVQLRRGMRALWNILNNNPYLASEQDLVFLGHPRRKPTEDGHWEDIYCDPLLPKLDKDSLLLEGWFRGKHRTPSVTDEIRYLDILRLEAYLRGKLSDGYELPGAVTQRLEEAEAKLEDRAGGDVDLVGMVREALERRRALLPAWQRLLRHLEPRLMVLVSAYGKETLIEACQREGVQVAELQHGVIHRHHLGYTYPGDRQKIHKPDHLLVWGDWWKDAAALPFSEDQIYSTGFPYYNRERARFKDENRLNRVVFLSQGTIGEDLSRVAVELDDLVEETDVVYKLHPGEVKRWRKDYPWLDKGSIRVITDEVPLYKLLATAQLQVGVYSTVVYEGLGLQTPTAVMDLPGSYQLDPLVERGYAVRVQSARDISRILNEDHSVALESADTFFEPDALERTCSVLEELAEAAS